MCIGFLVLAFGILGLISLFRDNPGVFEPHSGPRARGGVGGRLGRAPALTRALADRRGHRVPRVRDARAVDLHRHAGLAHHRVDPRVPRFAPGARSGGGGDGGGGRGARPASRQAGAPLDPRGARPRRARRRRRRPARVARGAGRGARARGGARARRDPADEGTDGLHGERPVPTAAARPAADGAALHRGRPRRAGHDGGARTHAPDVRRRRPRHGLLPRSDRLDVRGGHRRRHQGEQGPAAVERHRVRAGHARRAHHRADPRQVRDRRRGAEQAPRLRDARRHPALQGREGGDAPAHGRARQGRPRPAAAGEPGDDAAHPDRGRDGRGQVQPDQLLHHVDPDADHARRRPSGADRPEARGAQPLRGGAAPACRR